MPMPKPGKDESKEAYVERFMGDKVMNQEYPDQAQRYAICMQQWRDKDKVKKEILLKGELTSVDKKHRVVYGWAYVSKRDGEAVVDHSGDTWDMAEIEKTAHEFVIECRVGKERHGGEEKAVLVESMVFSKAVQEALGIDLKQEGWFVGFRILDDEVLQKIESGEYRMFSIGGTGIREEVD